ncbi:hypothetical protein NIES4075_32160 [Tolypothrix sp. NIES-4075]|uniref:hypothetical protein n=1 Tax=Tolypothrix sp. NIES-4075 TaxID=2005459 RepID=UPI000B6A3949|nr:hypothetical protein [Tolypothrix sp. NIES-4075]GAX42216.1 hypothetical protein NIES4075_32160 [Tolypothrix sp. NIES-4075]
MTANRLQKSQGNKHFGKSNSRQINLQTAQERTYKFLVEIVHKWSPEDVLKEFKLLFIDCLDSVDLNSAPSIYAMFYENNEQEFRHTLKRCCYIIVNNWDSQRKHKYIKELVELFVNYKIKIWAAESGSNQINIYQKWLINFVNSNDYEELRLFALRHKEENKGHWTNRYTTYLLVAQSFDKNNPKEQQEAALKLSKQMKDKFKFELAMYIARSQSAKSSETRYRNPTILGDNVLHLIKTIVLKKGAFSHENLANIFLRQTQNQSFKLFKDSLQKYLIFSVERQDFVETLKQQLSDKISPWKKEYDEQTISKELLLRTCNRVIDCLTTEKGREPSQLFVLLLSQGHPLTLVVVLLKVILICQNARSHLEIRMADLIGYYDNYPEDECQWVINFIEIFNITFAIYAENVEYNLINMKQDEQTSQPMVNLDAYRVFSQLKVDALRRGDGGMGGQGDKETGGTRVIFDF